RPRQSQEQRPAPAEPRRASPSRSRAGGSPGRHGAAGPEAGAARRSGRRRRRDSARPGGLTGGPASTGRPSPDGADRKPFTGRPEATAPSRGGTARTRAVGDRRDAAARSRRSPPFSGRPSEPPSLLLTSSE